MISLRNITKVFGKQEMPALALVAEGVVSAEIRARIGATVALRNITLDIPRGGVFVLMGLSGSGKSTLIRHLNRLIEPSTGEILVGGQDIRALDANALQAFRQHSVSMVFQGYGLLPHLSVIDNIAFGLTARGETKVRAREAAREWASVVALDGYENALPDVLSGGMKQRVGLARALATETPVLLMDEPFSALDPLIRADMQHLLQDLQKRLAKTIIFVTHDLSEAVRIGDTIAIMRDGQVVQVGTPTDILNRPADEYVARFVTVQNR